jgi:hypothetical protein
MITFVHRRHFSSGRAPRPVIIFEVCLVAKPLNDSTFTAREWPGRPVSVWPQRSPVPQSFVEWFLTTMPVCMIIFGALDRVCRAGAPFLA